jgi:hypothetical protein
VRTIAIAALLCAVSPAAFAAPPKAPPKPPTPPAPPPSIAFTIDAPSARQAWRMKIENTGDIPVRLTADARLVELEITPPNAKKAIHCALPVDMRPTNDIDRALVLPAKRSYSESFDPRLYCFGTHETALVAGAKVVAHYGFLGIGAKAPAKPAPPFVVSPFDGVEPAVAPLKTLVAAPITLTSGEPVSPAPTPPPLPKEGDDPFPPKLSLAVPKHVEASQPLDLAVTVTVSNDGSRPVTLLFRPETIGFDIIGPDGAMRCSWPGNAGGAVREAFTTLAPKTKQSVNVIIGAVCPDVAFNQGGLFIVRPRLDTRYIDPDPRLHAFKGEVIGTTTTLMRIHHGRHAPKVVRPRLD